MSHQKILRWSCRWSSTVTGSGPRPTLRMVPRISAGRGGDVRVSKMSPWIFRNEASNVDELRALGQSTLLVNVENSEGRELGAALCNLSKGGATGVNIIARMLTDNVSLDVDRNFFIARVKRALEHRAQMLPGETFYRLLNSEGDLMPGVVCDRYGDVLCLQFTALATEVLCRDLLISALQAVLSPRAIVLRCDVQDDRILEMAPIRSPELISGALEGPIEVPSEASGFRFTADLLEEGWSSGHYFAERLQRSFVASALQEISCKVLASSPRSSAKVGKKTEGSKGRGKGHTDTTTSTSEPIPDQEDAAEHSASSSSQDRRKPQVSPDSKVLSLFGESLGIFSATLGARATCAVQRGPTPAAVKCQEMLRKLAERNSCGERVDIVHLGKEPSLAELGGDGLLASFDVVSLEPSAFAPTYGKLEEGMRLYTAWCSLAASVTKPGGLMLFTCRSRTMTPVKLLRCVNLGVWSAQRKARLVHRSMGAGVDFPMHFALSDTHQMHFVALRIL